MAFEQSHGGFFFNLTPFFQRNYKNNSRNPSNIYFNSKTGTHYMSKMKFTTPNPRQKDLGKKVKKKEKKLNKKTPRQFKGVGKGGEKYPGGGILGELF
ncbi:hypothetical protein AWI86_15520 [Listeria monocytogenes]|nr:hypothetical protein AWI86_15520 [Listeria monocytogenes]